MTPPLSEYFPEDYKRQYAEGLIVPGMVLKLYCNFPNNPHDKRLIVLHKSRQPYFFKINYQKRLVYIRWIGTHPEYDKIDATKI